MKVIRRKNLVGFRGNYELIDYAFVVDQIVENGIKSIRFALTGFGIYITTHHFDMEFRQYGKRGINVFLPTTIKANRRDLPGSRYMLLGNYRKLTQIFLERNLRFLIENAEDLCKLTADNPRFHDTHGTFRLQSPHDNIPWNDIGREKV